MRSEVYHAALQSQTPPGSAGMAGLAKGGVYAFSEVGGYPTPPGRDRPFTPDPTPRWAISAPGLMLGGVYANPGPRGYAP